MNAQITVPFVDAYEEQWYELKLVPDIVVPLTPFGTLVANHLITNADQYVTVSTFGHRGLGTARDIAARIQINSQRESEYIDKKEAIYEHLR